MNILIVYANSGRGLEKDSRILAENFVDMSQAPFTELWDVRAAQHMFCNRLDLF